MELNEFIEKTLVDILKGVKAAQSSAANTGGKISGKERTANTFQNVDFDVAVTISSGSEGGIKVAAFGLGAGAGGSSERESATRIRFTVPVVLPAYGPNSSANHNLDTAW